ncbi:MAG: helicase [Armatimonadetes bacterium]|nr:helicase [Armatimonadota bacterium]
MLTQRVAHLDSLAKRLGTDVDHLFILHGGLTPKQRVEALDALKSAPDEARRVILATGSFIGEGFDDARLDTLFLAMPISWKGTLIQYTGRLHRYHPDKREVRIYDYVDSHVPVLQRMFEKRLVGYRSTLEGAGRSGPVGPAEACWPGLT